MMISAAGVRQGWMYPVPNRLVASNRLGDENNYGRAKGHSMDPPTEVLGPGFLRRHTRGHIQAKTEKLRDVARTTGLEFNVTKTKNLRKNASQEAPITFDCQAIEKVEPFTYVGSTVSKTGGTDEVVKAKINKARQASATLGAVWRSKNLSCGAKLRLFNNNVKPALLYGTETWKGTKNLDHKLQVFINTGLRRILRIRWPERISSQAILPKTRKWKWIRHTLGERKVVFAYTSKMLNHAISNPSKLTYQFVCG